MYNCVLVRYIPPVGVLVVEDGVLLVGDVVGVPVDSNR